MCIFHGVQLQWKRLDTSNGWMVSVMNWVDVTKRDCIVLPHISTFSVDKFYDFRNFKAFTCKLLGSTPREWISWTPRGKQLGTELIEHLKCGKYILIRKINYNSQCWFMKPDIYSHSNLYNRNKGQCHAHPWSFLLSILR